MADAPALSVPKSPTIVSASEAAAVLRVSRSQVYRLMDRKELESVRLGGRRLILWDSVLRILEPATDSTAS